MNNESKASAVIDIGDKKCNCVTCIHHAAGYCTISENECNFIEKDCTAE